MANAICLHQEKRFVGVFYGQMQKRQAFAGAARDVFATEPITDSPLFAYDQVIATPHLGASTVEAQDKAGVVVAEQIVLALAGQFVPFAVNVAASEASDTVQPFLPLAERYGLMPQVDRWVITQVFAALVAHGITRRDLGKVAINLSGSSVSDPRLLNHIDQCLATSGLDPAMFRESSVKELVRPPGEDLFR